MSHQTNIEVRTPSRVLQVRAVEQFRDGVESYRLDDTSRPSRPDGYGVYEFEPGSIRQKFVAEFYGPAAFDDALSFIQNAQ